MSLESECLRLRDLWGVLPELRREDGKGGVGLTRKVKCWLVCDCTGEWEDYSEFPVRAFDRRESAEHCAEVRGERHKRDEDEYSDPIWCRVYETEIVLEGEKDGSGYRR